ncbi:MAG: 16S rRNA methyltransferase [Candidatus Thorarchaeota archaeon]|nr:16S rRNA methyltransferase [Candidatus Thorarchaeota archaeon]
MLTVILLDCALEIVPSEISSFKDIQKQAGRKGKKPNEILLDQTYHGRAMTKLDKSDRRGRPDIIFHSLVTLLETPLCKEGLLRVYLHLQDKRVVEINPEVRLPRNYDRFVGLMEQLLIEKRVPVEGEPLLEITRRTLTDLLSKLKEEHSGTTTILAIEGGKRTGVQDFRDLLPDDASVPVVVGIGAFPHGDLSEDIKQLFDLHLELDREVMMAWHVCAEVLWIYSERIDVIRRRYS